MDRKTAKNILLKQVNKDIEIFGEDAITLASPMKGKNSWTYKEYKQAIVEDKCLENTNLNPIDTLLEYDKYLIKTKGHGYEENNK